MKDPNHPSLYYHLVRQESGEPLFALSFLDSPPSSAESSAILGWLPAVADGAEEGESGLNDFMENSMLQNPFAVTSRADAYIRKIRALTT